MNTRLKMILAGLLIFVAGFSLSNIAFSDEADVCKVAVVDVQKLAAEAQQVIALKNDQKTKYAELNTFVQKARTALRKEPNATKRKALEQRYNNELNSKKQAIDNDYNKKQADIETNLKQVIADQAKKSNYSIVLAKGAVLFGGNDITDDVLKSTK